MGTAGFGMHGDQELLLQGSGIHGDQESPGTGDWESMGIGNPQDQEFHPPAGSGIFFFVLI